MRPRVIGGDGAYNGMSRYLRNVSKSFELISERVYIVQPSMVSGDVDVPAFMASVSIAPAWIGACAFMGLDCAAVETVVGCVLFTPSGCVAWILPLLTSVAVVLPVCGAAVPSFAAMGCGKEGASMPVVSIDGAVNDPESADGFGTQKTPQCRAIRERKSRKCVLPAFTTMFPSGYQKSFERVT